MTSLFVAFLPIFQSTLPVREVTSGITAFCFWILISIHTSLAGSDIAKYGYAPSYAISIHTSLAGSDDSDEEKEKRYNISIHTSLAGSDWNGSSWGQDNYISIHTSRKGSDSTKLLSFYCIPGFQSTLPVREVTFPSSDISAIIFISIHTSRKGSDVIPFYFPLFCLISIHTSRKGSDPLSTMPIVIGMVFQSTLPVREVTYLAINAEYRTCYFNPHFP